MRSPRLLAAGLTVLSVFLAAPAVRAQSAENVAIVINDSSEDSRRVGEYYAKTRGLPESNVLRIRASTAETIGRLEYLTTIEQPLGQAIRRAGLQDRLLYLVLAKGVPLRVVGTRGPTGTVASVDSELTLLYRRLVGVPVAVDGRIDNPYYLGDRQVAEARPFSHRDHDIYLVTRLDAFTVDQALSLVDRARAPATEGRIVLDQRAAGGSGDQWMERAASRLTDQGQGPRVLLESTAKGARDEKRVLGYYSWGASDPQNRVRSNGLGFVPGSIAANLASFDARTFREPPADWRPTASADKAAWFEGSADALIGDLIRDGVTGVAGQVDEAFAFGAVRPEILFPAYLSGFNLAEAFYLATPTLSWQTVVIGDPLCAPFGRKPLARDELEDPADPSTGYPGLFAKRRLAVVMAANRQVPEIATPLMRAEVLLDRGDAAGARGALREAVGLAPQAVGPMVTLAQVEEQLGDVDAAIALYRRVLEAQPDHIVALNNIAYVLAVRKNEPAEALPFARRAVQKMPPAAAGTLLDTLGWIEHLLGNESVAVQVFEQAVRLAPSQAQVRLHAAVVFAAAGKADLARNELNEALRLDPSLDPSDDVRQLRERIGSAPPAR